MYFNVLDIDPRSPPFWQPISAPFGFSEELADECGLYETYGWSTATMPFKDGLVPPEVLLEDVEFTMGWRERLTHAQLERDDWKVLMSVFSTTDRVQHMMYQYYDEGHPMYDEAEASKTEAAPAEAPTRGGWLATPGSGEGGAAALRGPLASPRRGDHAATSRARTALPRGSSAASR